MCDDDGPQLKIQGGQSLPGWHAASPLRSSSVHRYSPLSRHLSRCSGGSARPCIDFATAAGSAVGWRSLHWPFNLLFRLGMSMSTVLKLVPKRPLLAGRRTPRNRCRRSNPARKTITAQSVPASTWRPIRSCHRRRRCRYRCCFQARLLISTTAPLHSSRRAGRRSNHARRRSPDLRSQLISGIAGRGAAMREA